MKWDRPWSSKYLEGRAAWQALVWLWLPPCLVLLFTGLAADRPPMLSLASLFGFGLVVSAGLLLLRPPVRLALIIAFASLGLSAVMEAVIGPRVWETSSRGGLSHVLERLDGVEVDTVVRRSWRVGPGDETGGIVLQAHLVKGNFGWDWLNSGGQSLTLMMNEPSPYLRVATASGGDPYLMRTHEFARPVGGSTFRVEVELRSPRPIKASGCRGIWLQTWGEGAARACKPVALGTDWTSHELHWSAPENARSKTLRLVLNDFNGLTYDVRNVRLSRLVDGTWRDLGPSMQEQVTLSARWRGGGESNRTSATFVPTKDGTELSIAIPARPPGSDRLVTELTVASGQQRWTTVRAQNPRLVGPVALTAVPILDRRFQLWFEHPNLAGHTLLAVALPLLVLFRSLGWRALLTLMALVLIGLTGSRAAFAVAVFAGLWALRHCVTKAWGVRVGTLILGGLGAMLLAISLQVLPQFDRVQTTSRALIWSHALQAFYEAPLLGLPYEFATSWQNSSAGGPEIVTHAHNLWLHFAATAGMAGVAASLWFTIGIIIIGYRQGLLPGLIAPLLLANLLDVTLFFAGVFLPLLLVLFKTNQVSLTAPARFSGRDAACQTR